MARAAPILRLLLGVTIGVLTWWIVDALVVEQRLRLHMFEPLAPFPILMLAVGSVSTVLVALSWEAALAAAVVLVVGIAYGQAINYLVVSPPQGDLSFVILRGAFEPTMPVLAGVWTVLGVRRLLLERRGAAPRIEESPGPADARRGPS